MNYPVSFQSVQLGFYGQISIGVNSNEPPKEKTYIDPFNAEEQAAIIKAAAGSIKNQCIVFFWTGMRTSELIALEWTDIDWKRKKIKINKAHTYAAKSDESTKTKTKSSNREIDMPPHVEAALINQKLHTLLQDGKVLLNPLTSKQWAGDQQIRKGFWIPLLKKAGVRYRNPYQTRHTFASMMLSAGENIAWVSAQMGHSNVLITAKTMLGGLAIMSNMGQRRPRCTGNIWAILICRALILY